MKVIPNDIVTNVSGHPLVTFDIDEDGRTKKDPKTDKEVEKKARVSDLMRIISLSIPRSIQAQNDPIRVYQIHNSLLKVKDGQPVELKDKVYDWLFRVLNREVPLTAEKVKEGLKPLSYAQELWAFNSACIIEQLKVPDERKDLNDWDE